MRRARCGLSVVLSIVGSVVLSVALGRGRGLTVLLRLRRHLSLLLRGHRGLLRRSHAPAEHSARGGGGGGQVALRWGQGTLERLERLHGAVGPLDGEGGVGAAWRGCEHAPHAVEHRE